MQRLLIKLKSSDYIAVIMVVLLFVCCDHHKKNEIVTLAKVGNRTISAGDFVRRAELSPLPVGVDITTQPGRRQALELLIREKLFALDAEQKGFQDDPLLRKKMQAIERSAVGRELYRNEVRNKVVIDEDEIRSSYEKMNEKLTVRYLQTRELQTAKAWKKKLDAGLPIRERIGDYAGEPIRDDFQTIEFTWGKAEPPIEDAAYGMVPGEISPVIPVSNGFVILQLLDRQKEINISDYHFTSRRKTVEKIIRRRWEAVYAGQYVENFMKNKGVTLKGEAFSILAGELEKWIDFEADEKQTEKKVLIEQEVVLIDRKLADHLDDDLVQFKGGEWTLKQSLEKLWLNEIPLSRKSSGIMRKDLQEAVRILVRDELLAREGYRKGLDKTRSVQQDVTLWRDHFYYVLMKNHLLKEGRNPESYFKTLKQIFPVETDADQLNSMELTEVPMIAVWTDFQRQLIVPVWPQLRKQNP